MNSGAIIEKWEKAGFLEGLIPEMHYKFSMLLENQSKHIQKEIACSADLLMHYFLKKISLALVRRTFVKLQFPWEVADKPSFEFNKKTNHVNTEKLSSEYDISYFFHSEYSKMDAEILAISFLSEKIIKELNERYENKYVIFFTPLIPIKAYNNDNILKLCFRAKEFKKLIG